MIDWLNSVDANVIDLFLLGKVIIVSVIFVMFVYLAIDCKNNPSSDKEN